MIVIIEIDDWLQIIRKYTRARTNNKRTFFSHFLFCRFRPTDMKIVYKLVLFYFLLYKFGTRDVIVFYYHNSGTPLHCHHKHFVYEFYKTLRVQHWC